MSEQRDFCLGASVSARHTSEMNGRISDWGQHSELHTCGENGILSIYICIYGMFIFYIYILPYLCTMQYFHIAHWSMLVLCPAHAHLPARNGLVNEVEFLGLIS